MDSTKLEVKNTEGIAIVGMAGKFPGVENIYEYWDALKEGKELLKRFSDEELKANSIDEETKKHKYFVPVNGLIHTAEYFDSSFFGFTPREADLTDPQHRKFLEVSYEALEHAGQSPDNYPGTIGVFAGCSMNNYLLKNLLQHPELLKNNGEFQTIVNNDKDFLTTKVSYKLNLTGPSFDIQSACSTSLVAIHVACQNLLNYQCNIALGGGSFIMNPRGQGYLYKPGGIESPVGECRPFDKDANGTVFGEGVGVVVLKRLEDAIAEKDEIWAVIRASAINNDGSFKIGYMAPSADGQAESISMALEFGDIDPRTISYVEAHGTGTNLGDPIEVSGLTSVYRKYTEDKNYCAIGSVKGNIGHCDVAAGVAGIIKTAMALKFKEIPPSINFETVNPELNLDASPFYVNTELKDWETNESSRRAAVSSMGIGGTNAHCILEEWDENITEPSDKEIHLLPLTAKSNAALDKMIENLNTHLELTDQEIGDIAFTLQKGRNYYTNRALLIGKSKEEIANNFKLFGGKNIKKGTTSMSDPATVFMFTGQGSQYINMAKGLYTSFDLFKNIVDEANEILNDKFEIDIISLLFDDVENKEKKAIVNLTSNTQPLLFVVQYATACLLIDAGVFPDALTGHSIGELTAATLSGVFSFEDALFIVGSRGKIMQEQKPGSMLSVNMSAEKLAPYLNDKVELALKNAPNYSVVSGTKEDIVSFEAELKNSVSNVHTTILKTSHAFHSSLMEPALAPFKKVFENIEVDKPQIPFISNVTGTWITPDEAGSPDYWANHIRSTVNFSDGINEIMQSESEILFIEVGPGNSLSMLLSQFDVPAKFKTIQTIRHPRTNEDDTNFFYNAISEFWINGGNINWDEIYEDEVRYKVPLPTYPFERKRHWIDSISNQNYYAGNSENAQEQNTLSLDENVVKQSPKSANLHKRPELDIDYAPPSSQTEKFIVEIWEELLGIDGIGINDDFFDLGGHSLLASQLIVRINENFNVKLPLDSIFSSPTVESIISKYNLAIDESAGEEEVKKDSTLDYYPLSQEQKRLWMINKIDQNNPAYNIPFTYRLNGNLNIEILEKSFAVLLNRHIALKTYIDVKDGKPVGRISPESYKINYIDLTGEDVKDINSHVQDILSKEVRTSFDIENGPLIRLTLLKTGKESYIFHLTVQHMVFDGWSWGIFSKEISQVYNDLIENKEVSLSKLDMGYPDFCTWQEDNIDKLLNPESIEFWSKQLKGIPLETKFPYDHKRPEIISGVGERESIEIDEKLTSQIKSLSKENGSTLFMTMLTGFGTLVNLYSHEDDICIGTPTANRTKSKFEKIIGFFVNTIVFRLKFDKSLSFKEILGKNKKIFLESLEHQDLPFEKLVDILQPERVMNINPLFQIMFAWQNAPRPPLSFNGINQERVVVRNGISPLDITFYMWENKGKIEGEIEYNSDILERESINHLKSNFIKLLEEIVEYSDAPIASLSGISEYSKLQLEEFNATTKDIPNKLLHELFEDIVLLYPEKEAVKSGDKKLTYAELNEEANALAHGLIKQNVQGSYVGVSLPRSEQMLVTILAILKAGGSYLPLDPDFPDERLKYILRDSGAKLLITNKNLKSKFNGIDTKIILLDKKGSIFRFSNKLSENPNLKIEHDSIAYAIYTSGSTGNPKGVKVPHSAVVNFILSMAEKPGMTKKDRLLAVTTLSFDISVLELFLPISVGASVIIAQSDDIKDGKSIIKIMNDEAITILQATPATWNLLLLSGWQGKPDLTALCGGEALPRKLAGDLYPKVKELWNMYGPTETTVWSTCEKIEDPALPVLIGKPINNTQIFILDKENKELPIGVFGEVCIGGKGVTKGYHNKSKLTKDKFITFVNNQVIYKTGDSGRILPKGNIELQGRIDNQIKLRGFRIEPGEIESLISNQAGIKEVVVKVQSLDDFDERLIAFLHISVPPSQIDVDRLKSNIGSRLPHYMVPSNFVLLKEFPRTPNGKIDRKSLIFVPGNNNAYDEKGHKKIEKPKNATETRILEIWQDLLKANDIGVNQNFFDVGGNSLMAITVVEKIEKAFNIELNLRIFFDKPVIESVAEYILLNYQDEEELKTEKLGDEVNIVQGEI